MEMKEFSTLPLAPELEPHFDMQFSTIPRTLFDFDFRIRRKLVLVIIL